MVKNSFLSRLNGNQLQIITRLILEIEEREAVSRKEIIRSLNPGRTKGKNFFLALRRQLLKRRFPLTSSREKIEAKDVFLPPPRQASGKNWQVNHDFKPLKIFVEKKASGSRLLKNFTEKFPETEVEELEYYNQYLKSRKFKTEELKKPLVFIVNEKWDFLKPCPCSPGHVSCGYWIFNLGFGCPFDCSYCFLQQYSNFPGIVLPANLNDFFERFDRLAKKLKKPIRIGTGEFCDSLALDYLTEYSLELIPYFKEKNVYFELKTKSAEIGNLLKISGSKNIVISWSLNPKSLIDSEEKEVASLKQRLAAAKKARAGGYEIGFHFDPIIHSADYRNIYGKLIKQLYQELKPPFAWISLGTLRCHRKLKAISQSRFPESKIFYGELMMAEDKKLRYPQFLRREIYENMLGWIKAYDQKTPVYLCMEDKSLNRLSQSPLPGNSV